MGVMGTVDKAELLRQRRRMGKQNSNGRLQIPGQIPINIQRIPAPLAQPACFSIATPQGCQWAIVGGLSPLQHFAAQALASGADGEVAFQRAKRALALCHDHEMALAVAQQAEETEAAGEAEPEGRIIH